MKQYYKIDDEGYYIEPVILTEEPKELPDDLIGVKLPDGFYKARWDGEKWLDDITEEELNAKEEEARRELMNAPPSYEELGAKIRTLENVVNEVLKQTILSENLTDEQKSELISKYREVHQGDTVFVGEVVNIDGELFKMIQPVPITIHDAKWLKDASLFAPFLQATIEDEEDEEVHVVEEFRQPTGAHDAYQIDDLVRFNEKIYVSLISNNVWSPTDNPAGWSEHTE